MKSYTKFLHYSALAILGLMAMTACDTDIESLTEQGTAVISKPTFSDMYYQNLRDYKETDHEIAFGWFSQYGNEASMGKRFAGIPDSMDIVSLWGGIPSFEVDIQELQECRSLKGMKFLLVDICQIRKQNDEYAYKARWNEITGDDSTLSGDELTEAKMEVMRMWALRNVDQVFDNNLDGYDLDYEPEGDAIVGDLFNELINTMALYLGPNPNITTAERYQLIKERYGSEVADMPGSCEKLLCIDAYGAMPSTNVADIINYLFSQDYNGIISRSGYPNEKIVHCMSVGEDWSNDPSSTTRAVGNYYTKEGRLYDYARYEPSTGHKGGFGGFIFNEDYTITSLNPYPYARLRDCIQICNPAIR